MSHEVCPLLPLLLRGVSRCPVLGPPVGMVVLSVMMMQR